MGGGIAAKTGETLLHDQVISQDSTAENFAIKPKLRIRAEMPVALGDSNIKAVQVPLGFAADSLSLLARSPYNRAVAIHEGSFVKELLNIFEKQGMPTRMDAEQSSLKRKGLYSMVTALWKGLPLDSKLKITKVIGTKDLTMYTSSFNENAAKQAENHNGTLGERIVPSEEVNTRTFAVRGSHTRPFFRKSQFRAMQRAAITLEKFSKGHS